MLLPLLTALLLAGSAAAALLPGNATKELLQGSQRFITAPVALEGALLESSQTPTFAACAQACSTAPDCVWFTATCPAAEACACELFASNCTLAPSVSNEVPPANVTVTSGVPLRNELSDFDIWAAADGQAVAGADLPECQGTQLPGRCAFSTLLDAALECARNKACQGFNILWQGVDGCGSMLLVLVSQGLSPNNSFVSPLVSSYTKRGASQDLLVQATEGTVIPPTAAELEAAAASSDPDSAWLGCIVAPRAVMAGALVEVLDNVASAQACCRACRAKGAATCNVYNFCAEPGGCTYSLGKNRTVSLTPGQCELRYNLAVNMAMGGFPPTVVVKGSQVTITGGAPMTVAAGSLPGYEALLAANNYPDYGIFNCKEENIRPALNDCWLEGSLQQLGDTCDRIPECVALSIKPGWLGLPESKTIAKAKNDSATDHQYLNPNVILMVNNTRLQLQSSSGSSNSGSSGAGGSQPSSSSSLSSGAIAGIAVGATVVALAAALGGWALLRRRQQRQRTLGGAGTNEEDSKAAGEEGTLPDTLSWSSSQPPGPGSSGPVVVASPAATVGSACQVERGFTLRSGTAVSPWAAMASRASTSAVAFSPFAHPLVSPFSGAGATPTRGTLPASSHQPGSPPFPSGSPGQSGGSGPYQSGGSGQYLTSSSAAEGLASLAGIPAVVPGAEVLSSAAGTSSGTASGSGSARVLPELQAHVAAMDAGMSVGSVLAGHENGADGGQLLSEMSLLVPTNLPEALRDVLVDLKELQPLRWPNGALQELGSGASATVYKVLFRGEAVAAKEMEVGRDLACQRSFIAEAERLHALRHAHLVPLYGVCLSGSKGILLLEFCAGRDLHSALAIKKQGGRGERLFGWYARGKQVALDVAKALNYLHSRSIVHLDIKSSNVLLTATGTAKLGDVGLARMQRGTALSCAPKAVGTFDYMAPEMITNSRCTEKVDLFSMGILLWEICTGERPRRGDMRLPKVPEECPQEVADLISQCMSLDPSERPTAQQLMQRLQDLHKSNQRAPPAAAAAATGATAGASSALSPASPAAADFLSIHRHSSSGATAEGSGT